MTKIIKKKNKPSKPVNFSSKKDNLIKALIRLCKERGVDIRRERLKQGFGWRATSGICMHQEKPVVFIDSRLEQDDQLEFLLSKIRDLNIAFNEEELREIPLKIQTQMVA